MRVYRYGGAWVTFNDGGYSGLGGKRPVPVEPPGGAVLMQFPTDGHEILAWPESEVQKALKQGYVRVAS